MLTIQEAIDKLNEMLENPQNITKSDLMEFANEVSVADNIAPEGSTTVLYSAMNGDVSFQTDDVRGIFHTEMWVMS